MLTIVATPIGNIQDISIRALEALDAATVVLCEDTRVTDKLYRLLTDANRIRNATQRRYISYHKFNEASRIDEVISLLKSGMSIILVSDAGTPCISDPGQRIVLACHEASIPVSIIPGPSACISAIAVSGIEADRFQFLGFVPKELPARRQLLRECLAYPGASVAYDTAERILETLAIIADFDKERKVCCIRELTKKFEEIVTLPACQLHELWQEKTLKGEISIVIAPSSGTMAATLSDAELVRLVLTTREQLSLPLSQACSLVAKTHAISKQRLYTLCLEHAAESAE